jgi:glycosyltransferase involved in cell wall biosynthesis
MNKYNCLKNNFPFTKAIDSFLWVDELILVDAGSTDGTLEKLKELYELNEFVFKIDMRFEPLVGEVYHVYQNDNSKNFLSMIAPHECNFLYICSIILNTDGQWVLQGGTIPKN